MAFIKGIEPTVVNRERWWAAEKLTDPMKLKPKPDRDVLLIVGDGKLVLEDLENFLDLGVAFDTMAINYSVKLIPWKIQHFIAGDSHMGDMQKLAGSLPKDVIRHCWNPNSKNFDIRWVRNGYTGWNGTTANLGIKIGIALGYTRIVLAGCPMDDSGNWYASSLPKQDVKLSKDHRAHLWKWTEIASRPISRLIRSMSGNTKNLLGSPSREWLLGEEEKENA